MLTLTCREVDLYSNKNRDMLEESWRNFISQNAFQPQSETTVLL